jgi:hypothetical protein
MSLENLISTVWAARLLANLHKALVYGQSGVVNRDYEGDIRQAGDSVRINAIGPVSIADYVKDSDLTAPESLGDAQTVLTIDRAKFFHFQIDDIDRVQQNPDAMNDAIAEAAYKLADEADQYIASLYAGVATTNMIGDDTTPKTDLGTATKAYEYLVDLDVMLTEANVPRVGRWVVVPAWYTPAPVTSNRRFHAPGR